VADIAKESQVLGKIVRLRIEQHLEHFCEAFSALLYIGLLAASIEIL